MCPAKKPPQLLIQKWQRRVNEWPTDVIIPVNELRECARDRCKEMTRWAMKGQRTKGYCLTCIPGLSFWTITPEHEARVVVAFLRAFPGTSVSQI